jgi:Ca2+-binding RTX toxin-like protein
MSTTTLRRILTAGTGLAVATALSAAPAHAAPTPGTVTLSSSALHFTAGPGATNTVSAAGTLDHFFYFVDERNDVTIDPSAATSCVHVTPRSVRCTRVTFVTFNLGDAADTFYTEGYIPLVVQGGTGGDTLTAGSSSARVSLFGQDGNDKLTGGDGDDLLDAGPGSHQSTAGGPGSDTCRGSDLTKTSCEKL